MPPKKRGRSKVYLLWGQEELRKREALAQLLDALVPAEDRDLDVQYMDASNAGVTAESILYAVRDRAMFSEQRVVVVLNAGRLRGPRHQRTQEALAASLASLPDYSTLIFMVYAEDADERRGRSPFGEKLMTAIRAAGESRQFALLKPEELARVAVEEAARAEKRMAQPAAALLVQRAGPDSHTVLQETRKLVSYVGERSTISREDVEQTVSAPPDDNVFHLLEATMAGNRQRSLELLRGLRESGVAVPQLATMLGRTLRQVAQARFLLDRRVDLKAPADQVPAEVMAFLPEEGNLYRGTADWQRQRLAEQARRISWEHLQHALDRLARMDAGTKGWEHGVEDPELALELFVIALCDTVRPAAASSGWSGRGRG